MTTAHASRIRRGLSRHRPRSGPLPDRSDLRPCAIVLALTGLALLAFPAVVIGGLESIPGAVVGGLIVGILQALVAGYYDPLAQDALVFAALLLMLLVKPTGLFGQKEILRV